MKNRILLFLSYLLLAVPISAQISNQENKLVDELNSFFNKYKQSGTDFEFQPKMEKYVLDNTNRTLDIYADDHFGTMRLPSGSAAAKPKLMFFFSNNSSLLNQEFRVG